MFTEEGLLKFGLSIFRTFYKELIFRGGEGKKKERGLANLLLHCGYT